MPGFVPRPFALCTTGEGDGDGSAVLAWGTTLPDGSAVAVDWRNGPSSMVAVCRSPDSAAALFSADLRWLDQPDTDPSPQPDADPPPHQEQP